MNIHTLRSAAGATATIGTAGASMGPPTVETGPAPRRSVLLVHGAWHTAAHWNEVTERLVTQGHRAVAMDLPGSGLNADYPRSYIADDPVALATEPSPIAGIGLDDYVGAVIARVEEMARYGTVTLVGHSMGGMTITRVAEAVPHLLRRLVYVSAYVPVAFATAGEYSQLPENSDSRAGAIVIADPATIGAVRINPRNGDPGYLEAGRQALYNDVPSSRFLRFAMGWNPDMPVRVGVEDGRGTPQRWGRVPRTFIRTTRDHCVPLALQDRMIREADAATPDNRFAVRTLDSSHSPFASRPRELADLLVDD